MEQTLVSLYRNATDRNGVPARLLSILHAIRNGRWEPAIEALRSAKSENEYNALKRSLPGFTPSGLFEPTRAAANLKSHSGVIAIDIDAKENAHTDLTERVYALSAVKFVQFIAKSAGGKGFFVLFRINPQQHTLAYEHISAMLKKHFDITTDKACKDVSRLRFVSCDKDAYINEHAEVLNINIKHTKQTHLHSKHLHSNYLYSDKYDDVLYIAERCKCLGISLLESYTDWYTVGQSLADYFGETGRELFHALSSTSAKYTVVKTDKQYDYCLKKRKSANSSLGFLFKQALFHGILVKERYASKTRPQPAPATPRPSQQPAPVQQPVQQPPVQQPVQQPPVQQPVQTN
ncbi:MAG: BT4734/BF3469 family protein, partial [Cytophagales bacterium]|nr:BT4734/BF3469 family protein [Cytophagales bacterium]